MQHNQVTLANSWNTAPLPRSSTFSHGKETEVAGKKPESRVQAELNAAQTLNTVPRQHPLLEGRIKKNSNVSFRESLEFSVVE